jgi:hypothetical protein
MADSTGQQNNMIKSVKSGLPEEPAPIAVYAATPFNAQDPASSKQPITAAGVEDKTDFKYFQRQVSFFVIPANVTALQYCGKHDSSRYCMWSCDCIAAGGQQKAVDLMPPCNVFPQNTSLCNICFLL